MAYTNRGGPPIARSLSVSTAGAIGMSGDVTSVQDAGKPFLLPAMTSWVRFYASKDCIIYFTQEDYNADGANHLDIPSALSVELPLEIQKFWAKAKTTDAVLSVLAVAKV